MDWFDGSAEQRRDLVKRCAADRDLLLETLTEFFPHTESLRPAERVEMVLTDLCGFHVVDEPLCEGQLGLCDFNNRMIIINSKMGNFVHHKTNLALLRSSTLAHELGHIRLHQDEVSEKLFINHYGSQGAFSDARAYQKEREADLYAGLFLVSIEELLAERRVQSLLRNREAKRQMSHSTLWNLLYALAHRFRVSPSLMKRCLFDLGWIGQGRKLKSGLSEICLKL